MDKLKSEPANGLSSSENLKKYGFRVMMALICLVALLKFTFFPNEKPSWFTSWQETAPTITTITVTKDRWSDPVTPPRFTSITYGPTEKSVKWQVMIDGVEVHTVTNDFTKVVLSDKRHVSWQWRLLPEDAKSSREFAYYFVLQGTR